MEVIEGDTEMVAHGTGTFGSRSTVQGGSALVRTAEKVVEKARRIAAYWLEASVEDVEFEDGRFHVTGAPQYALTFEEVATAAYETGGDFGDEPRLDATTFYESPNTTFPFSSHVAVVEVDTKSGEIDVETYVAVDDCGTQINPIIVEGQVHGGIAQRIGQALYEDVVYDDARNLLSATLQDYVVPKAEHIPSIETDTTVTPSSANPLGAKGIGESGAIGAPAAISNAVVDVLRPFGVDYLDRPITPKQCGTPSRRPDSASLERYRPRGNSYETFCQLTRYSTARHGRPAHRKRDGCNGQRPTPSDSRRRRRG